MNKRLAELFAIIDSKYDIEVQEYFNLPKADREELAEILAENLYKQSNNIPQVIHSFITQLHNVVRESELNEEYEKADIFFNIEKKLFDRLDTLL